MKACKYCGEPLSLEEDEDGYEAHAYQTCIKNLQSKLDHFDRLLDGVRKTCGKAHHYDSPEVMAAEILNGIEPEQPK